MKTTFLRVLACVLAVLSLTICFVACDKGGDSALYFSAGGEKIAIGASDDVLDKLGTPLSETSSESCGGFDGKDYVYTYKGYRVSTTPAKNGQIICKVELTDDSVKTPEGVYIGMSRAEAETAMKAYTAESVGDNLVYAADGVKLQVVFRDGFVSGLIYVAE
jgi:hypothetical protein